MRFPVKIDKISYPCDFRRLHSVLQDVEKARLERKRRGSVA